MHVLSGRAFCGALLSLAALQAPSAFAIGKYDARDGEECRAQVNANYDAIARDMAAHGNYRGIASMEERGRAPALKECNQMDQSVRARRLMKAHERLTVAIELLRSGGHVADAAMRAIEDDYAAIIDFPKSSYRDACLDLHTQLVGYAHPATPSSSECPRIAEALRQARREHDAAVDALLRHEPNWRTYEQTRQAAVAEMQFQEHLGKRAGCPAR